MVENLKIFITGGSGFVGSNLVAGLNSLGIRPIVLHRPDSSLEALNGLDFDSAVGDILDDPSSLASRLAGSSWVFHTAGVSDYWRSGFRKLYRVNVDGTRNILTACSLAGVDRFIFTSSLSSFGIPDNGRPINEDCTFNLRPDQLPYGHSKHLAELAVLEAISGGLDAVIVNPSIILGPRDIKQVSGSIVTEAARGLLRFNLPGTLSFVGVEDVVKGHLAAARLGVTGEKYILSGQCLTTKEAGRIVCEIVGRPRPKIDIPPWVLPPAAVLVRFARVFLGNRIPMDPNQVRLASMTIVADSHKAERSFGMTWTPFREIVKATFDWYVANGYINA